MLDFGAANSNNNAIKMSSVTACDFTGDFSFHAWLVLRDNANTAYLLTNLHVADLKGFKIFTDFGAGVLRLQTADGAGETDNANTTIDVDGTSVESYGISYDGSNSDFYKGGGADGTPAHTKNATYNGAEELSIGDDYGGNSLGGAYRVGQIMMWNTALSSGNMTTLDGTASIPARSNLKFWHKGTSVPGKDMVGGTSGTTVNTVTTYAHASDSYYEAPGGFSYMLACWAVPLVASGLFGANILHENMDKLIPVMRKVMGCHFVGEWNDYVRILESVTRRSSWLHLAPTNVL